MGEARDGAAGAIVLAAPPAASPKGRAAFDPAWARVVGRAAWTWAVDALAASSHIGRVALVVDAGRLVAARRLIAAGGWRTVQAVAPAEGDSDARGLAAWLGAGLAALADASAPDAVLLHEAMRPLLPASLLAALFAAWDGTSVVAAASPVKETLKAVDTSGHVRQTPPRDHLWQLRPPLLLPRPLLERLLAAPPIKRERDQANAGLTALIAHAPDVRLRLVPAGHDDVVVRRRADVATVVSTFERANRQAQSRLTQGGA